MPTPHSSNLPTSLCRSRGLFVLLNARPHRTRSNKPLPFNGLHTLRKCVSASPTFQSICALFEKHPGYTPKSEPPAKPRRKNSDRCPFRPTQFSRSELDHAPYARHSTRTRLAALHDAAAIARCDISRPRTGLRVRRPHLAKRERKPTTQSRGTRGNGRRRSARQLDSKGNNAWKGITSKEEKRGDRCLIR